MKSNIAIPERCKPSAAFYVVLLVVITLLEPTVLYGQTTVYQNTPPKTDQFRAKVDSLAASVLKKTGVPSASVAITRDGGRIRYIKAYGMARLKPRVPADTSMRYAIGSISKQFTSASILMLARQGKLSLNDHVAKWMPELTRADEITIRQLLSHTSGYQDFWPHDYVPPMMQHHKSPEDVLDRWAKKPLDFEPGTKWQYSNTNFLIAAGIIEQIAGEPIYQFVKENILSPLNMNSAVNYDEGNMTDDDPTGYRRYGLGPLRKAKPEGSGWMTGAAELAMTPRDLLKWDISLINRSLLETESYNQLEKEVRLKNGLGTNYGLGVSVREMDGHRLISHSGEVSGFTDMNMVFPDDGVAVVVLTNQMAARSAGTLAGQISHLIFESREAGRAESTKQAKKIFMNLEKGKINRSLFTSNANAYFSRQALQDFKSGLGPLGEPESFKQTSQGKRGGMISRSYRVTFPDQKLRVWTFQMPNGKLEQYQIAPVY